MKSRLISLAAALLLNIIALLGPAALLAWKYGFTTKINQGSATQLLAIVGCLFASFAVGVASALLMRRTTLTGAEAFRQAAIELCTDPKNHERLAA